MFRHAFFGFRKSHRWRHGDGRDHHRYGPIGDDVTYVRRDWRERGRGPLSRGGGARLFSPRDLRLILLAKIEEKSSYGYELIKTFEQIFGSAFTPGPALIYPTLTLLEELGYLSSSCSEGTNRLFEMTAEGRSYLRDHTVALQSASTRMQIAARVVSSESPPQDVHYAMDTLMAALMFQNRGWDAKEVQWVRQIIERAADAISRGSDHE